MFPRWIYNLSEGPRIVESQEALDALGNGWVDSPAALGIVTCPGDDPIPEVVPVPEPAGAEALAEPESIDVSSMEVPPSA